MDLWSAAVTRDDRTDEALPTTGGFAALGSVDIGPVARGPFVRSAAVTALALGAVLALLQASADLPPVVTERGGTTDLLLIGGLAFLALFNGLLFVSTRQTSYLLYCGYGLSTAVVYATYFDVAADALALDGPNRLLVNHLASGVTLALALGFVLSFLRVHRRRPRLNARVGGVSFGLGLFALTVLPFFPAPVRENVLAVPGLVLPMVALALGVDARRQGFRASRAYLAAWTPLLVVVVLEATEVVAAVDLGVGGRAVLGANLLEMLLLAIGLTERIRVAVAERERAHFLQVEALERAIEDQKKLGPYTLEGKIGEGGMGAVYRARHALLRRPTAVKIIRPERVDPETLQRFEREVRTTSRLTHPNTVTVYDYGRTPDGTLYYAMELLEGATLRQVVELTGPLDPGRVAHILAMVASALAEAHAIDLIHRDVKPSNIILTTQGGVPDVAKVVDFGLVKELSPDPEHPELSQNAVLAGTPLYMAPELTKNPSRPSPASDLYALGAVGYFLLTGKHLFGGGSVFEILLRHVQRTPPSPSEARGEALPPELEALLLELLAKDPGSRPQDAAEVATRLHAMPCAAEWTEADAAAWWERHGPALRFAPEDVTAPPGAEESTRPLIVRR
jgi:tRNA A-37 threonylcarbamoyl transferase component Bud32